MADKTQVLKPARIYCKLSRPPRCQWYMATGVSSGTLFITPNTIKLDIIDDVMNMDYEYINNILYSYFNGGLTTHELKDIFKTHGINIKEYAGIKPHKRRYKNE